MRFLRRIHRRRSERVQHAVIRAWHRASRLRKVPILAVREKVYDLLDASVASPLAEPQIQGMLKGRSDVELWLINPWLLPLKRRVVAMREAMGEEEWQKLRRIEDEASKDIAEGWLTVHRQKPNRRPTMERAKPIAGMGPIRIMGTS